MDDTDTTAAHDLLELLELRAIERLKYRYLRCVDLRLWDELAACLTAGATASYGGGTIVRTGRDEVVGFLRGAMPTRLISSHKCHHPEIDLVGPAEATGVWALDDVIIDRTLGISVRGAAYYDDRYVKVDGTWLIDHTGYKRVYEELTLLPAADAGGPAMTAHWWETDGRSSLTPTETTP
ncbi:MAG: nuclear transport factor 2 family protein [Actinobacteria bacterium]|nr:nuclear transport factor 2 family protein [Actinomycetota bacterium]